MRVASDEVSSPVYMLTCVVSSVVSSVVHHMIRGSVLSKVKMFVLLPG